MSLLKSILGAQGGALVEQLANQHGLDQSQASEAISKLLPALAGGMKRNAAETGGLESLMNAVRNGNHGRYMDNPREITQPSTIEDGNKILGHLLGSKDVSRAVASRAAEQTGIDVGALKQMLPAVAAMAMGAMNKEAGSPAGALSGLSQALGQGQAAAQAQGAGILGGLGAFLDQDNDGSAMDDLMGIAKKFF